MRQPTALAHAAFASSWTSPFPLTTPGYVTGALLVFIWTFADFATPLVVGVDDLLASQAYLNIVQFVDRRLFKMGIVISAIMVILAIIFLIVAKKYVAIKDYSSLSYSQIERRKLSPLAQAGVVVFLVGVLIFAFIPYFGIALDSFGKGWALTPFPGQIHACNTSSEFQSRLPSSSSTACFIPVFPWPSASPSAFRPRGSWRAPNFPAGKSSIR